MKFIEQLEKNIDIALLMQILEDGRSVEITIEEDGEYGGRWDWYNGKIIIDKDKMKMFAEKNKVDYEEYVSDDARMRSFIRRLIFGILKHSNLRAGPVKFLGLFNKPDNSDLVVGIEMGIPKNESVSSDSTLKFYLEALNRIPGYRVSLKPIRAKQSLQSV